MTKDEMVEYIYSVEFTIKGSTNDRKFFEKVVRDRIKEMGTSYWHGHSNKDGSVSSASFRIVKQKTNITNVSGITVIK